MSVSIQPGRMALAVTPCGRSSTREGADQRVERGLGAGVVLVARGAVERGEARGRDEPAETIADPARLSCDEPRPGRHERRRRDWSQTSCRHSSWVRSTKAAAVASDAGIGKAAVDPAELVEGRFRTASLIARRIGDVARPACRPAGGAGFDGSRRVRFLSRCGPRSRRAPAAASACAMPRPMPPLPPVMIATRPERLKILMVFPLAFPLEFQSCPACTGWRADGRRQPWTTALKNQIWPREFKIDLPRQATMRPRG